MSERRRLATSLADFKKGEEAAICLTHRLMFKPPLECPGCSLDRPATRIVRVGESSVAIARMSRAMVAVHVVSGPDVSVTLSVCRRCDLDVVVEAEPYCSYCGAPQQET